MRVQIMPEVAVMSPDCTPWVKTGRWAARLSAGIARLAAKAVPPARMARREGRRSLVMGCLPCGWPEGGHVNRDGSTRVV